MRLILAIIILCAVARADTKITWLADVTADRAETVTGVQSGQVANAVAHINRADNPHGVTAPQIGALTTEADTAALAALAAYAAYWPRNATASSWFTFTTNSGAIRITGYNIAGGTDVVIPDYINGLPVTEIGANAFYESGVTSIGGAGNVVTVGVSAFGFCGGLTSVSLPQVQTVGVSAFLFCEPLASVSLPQVQTVGDSAFRSCTSLASVSLPQVQTVGDYAFGYCTSLTSFYFDNDAPAIGADIFEEITHNQVKIYVTNPTATGWGATLAGMPVVRLPLYADAIYQAGELVATVSDIEAHNADAAAHAGKVSVTGGTATNLTLAGSITYTNGLTFGHGYYTNGPDYGVFYSINGTNYWELLK